MRDPAALGLVHGGYGSTRASAFTAYRRRLGPDADKLPGAFASVIDDVIAFADPVLGGALTDGQLWLADAGRWTG